MSRERLCIYLIEELATYAALCVFEHISHVEFPFGCCSVTILGKTQLTLLYQIAQPLFAADNLNGLLLADREPACCCHYIIQHLALNLLFFHNWKSWNLETN